MYLVVGLGNPGPKYARNRHNVGFRVIERLAPSADFREKFKGRWAKVRLGGDDTILLTPMTYMNLSGESVQAAMHFFKIPLENLIVIHDELDLPFATIRLKRGGGAAGHNGVRSVIQCCGPDFLRLRIGVGRPQRGSGESFVLSDFDASEGAELSDVLQVAARAVEAVIADGPTSAMNAFNVRKT
jgi:PTH1 family peptidyl-tRNA hydrolase